MELHEKKQVIAITGPSCSGKTTLGNNLKAILGYIVIKQTTTRLQREDDDINEFRYITHDEFAELVKNNKFYVWSGDSNIIDKENGNFYGILQEDIDSLDDDDSTIIMYISYKDVEQIREKNMYNTRIINLKIVDFDRIMSARMYKNVNRSKMGIDEFNKRLKSAKEYDKMFSKILSQYTYEIETDNMTNQEVFDKVLKIIRSE